MRKKILGVIGDPISHSISPAMHNAALKSLSLGAEIEYRAFHVKPPDLGKFADEIRKNGYLGINVTVPHKIAILQHLDETTRLAQLIGAVNTIKNDGGRLVGYNTDGPGFIEAVKTKLGFDPAGKKVVVLGAGGAARAVAMTLGENKAAQIVIFDVDEEKTRHLAGQVSSNFSTKVLGLPAICHDLPEYIAGCDLLVNATPLGMHPDEKRSPLPKGAQISANTLLYDLVYTPQETTLMKEARAAGATAANGLSMLVYQGALALAIFIDREAPVNVMEAAAEKALGI